MSLSLGLGFGTRKWNLKVEESKEVSKKVLGRSYSLELVSFKGGSVGSGSVVDPDLTTVS